MTQFNLRLKRPVATMSTPPTKPKRTQFQATAGLTTSAEWGPDAWARHYARGKGEAGRAKVDHVVMLGDVYEWAGERYEVMEHRGSLCLKVKGCPSPECDVGYINACLRGGSARLVSRAQKAERAAGVFVKGDRIVCHSGYYEVKAGSLGYVRHVYDDGSVSVKFDSGVSRYLSPCRLTLVKGA